MLTLLLPAALAADLSCVDLEEMAANGVAEAAAVALVEQLGVPSAELACVEASGALPATVKEAAGRHVIASQAPAPVDAPDAGSAEPTSPIPPRPPRPDPRELDPGLRAWMRGDPCSPINLAEEMPERGMALALSGIVGFGAGHFYARRPQAGVVFAFLEGASIATVAGGAVALQEDVSSNGDIAIYAGSVVHVLSRFADFVSAPSSARLTRYQMLDDCGW